MPYLYTQYWRAHRFGEPMLRPTFYEFDDDPLAYVDCDEFMVGNALLLAPVVAPGSTKRSLYLPTSSGEKTEWIDFHTGRRYAGGDCVIVDAPLERLPIFVRAGAVIAMTATEIPAALHDEPSRMLRVYAQGSGRAPVPSMLYEDDGISRGHVDGDSTTFGFALLDRDGAHLLEVSRSGRFAVPYRSVRVELVGGEGRRLTAAGDGSIDWAVAR